MTKRVLTLLVGQDDGIVQSYFGIEHEGRLWLVTRWLIERATQEAVPERMIRVDSLDQPPQAGEPGGKFDFVVPLLPKSVIEGLTQDMPGFEVRSLPTTPRVRRSDLYMLPSHFA